MHGQRMSTRWPEPLTLQPCCALYRANDRNCPVKIRTPALDKLAAWPPINEMARCALVAAQRSRLSRTSSASSWRSTDWDITEAYWRGWRKCLPPRFTLLWKAKLCFCCSISGREQILPAV